MASHRRREAAADVEVLGDDRAVSLLLRLHDDDLRAGLELVLVAGSDRLDHGLGADDHLLLALLVLDGERLAVLAGDLGAHIGVGHRRSEERRVGKECRSLWPLYTVNEDIPAY